MKAPDPVDSLSGLFSGLNDLGGDVINLTSLQARLAAEDLRESLSRAQPALIAMAVAVPLALSSFTVLLGGAAYWLSVAGILPLHFALIAVGLGGILVAGGTGMYIVSHLQASLTTFRRSTEELERNLAWLRTVLNQSGR